MKPETPGTKQDAGKPRWSLLDFSFLEECVKVLTFGAIKYPSPDNWKKVNDGITRYKDAGLRHFTAFLQGEENDKETGLSHLCHLFCCIMFLWYFNKQGKK